MEHFDGSFYTRLIDLGISAVLFGMFFYVFLKIHLKTIDNAKKAQEKLLEDAKEDRRENRESNEKNASEIAKAITRLADSHNRLRDDALRQAAPHMGKRDQ